MNLSSLLGFAIAAWVLWAGVFKNAASPAIFLDMHAIILVVGGTLAAGLIAFPFKRFFSLGKFFVWGLLFKRVHSAQNTVIELINAGYYIYRDPNLISQFSKSATHPFLAEGFQLIAENVLDQEMFEAVLKQRAKFFKTSYLEDAKMLNALAKFPPAFGLLGATSGMIAMMTGLGAGGQDTIGPAMAIALVATFWGIAAANLILLPLSDYATKIGFEDSLVRQVIIEGLVAIKARKDPRELEELLNSHLAVFDRLKIKRDHVSTGKTVSGIVRKTG